MANSPPEQSVVLEGVSWQQYELLLALLGDDFPTLRLNYLESLLEIRTNSSLHEKLKKTIGMLIESYFQETRTRFHGIGSATFRRVAKQRGLEPDECYCLEKKKEFPDLAIEIVLSSGIVDKLDIYQGLGVTEVWVWEAGQFTLYHLRSEGYEVIECSELLPGCDIRLLAAHVKPDEQFDAVMAYRDELRKKAAMPESLDNAAALKSRFCTLR
ncbi:MAG: Uma2 family endonuclease [Cyanobacteria bacterium J06597_16]